MKTLVVEVFGMRFFALGVAIWQGPRYQKSPFGWRIALHKGRYVRQSAAASVHPMRLRVIRTRYHNNDYFTPNAFFASLTVYRFPSTRSLPAYCRSPRLLNSHQISCPFF